IHPYASIAWKILTSVYQTAKKQQETDDKLRMLVETMVDVYSFVGDIEFLREQIKSLQNKVLAIVKQTVECAIFIQEYTANGFCSATWTNPENTIDDLSAALLKLKGSLDSSLAVQGLFLSTKILDKLDGLVQLDALKRLNPVDMNAALHTTCLPGTRRQLLNDIMEWIAVPSRARNILWLSGVAGSGKSTISTTISESLRAVERLGAFLFFGRDDSTGSHPDAVIRTLAYSLALSSPHICLAISAAIQRDPAVVNSPIRTQFTSLLLEPLLSAENSIQGPILIILDALDECGDRDSRAALLAVLSDGFPKLPSVFRIFISCRPEQDIIDQFGGFAQKHLNPGTSSSSNDVQLFIRHEMDRIRRKAKLGPTWPQEHDIQCLANLAGGLFIWASTAVRFIDGYRPDERLKTLISQNSQEFNLDALYSTALLNSGPWSSDSRFAQDAHAVLACVVLGRVPMTDATMDTLLDFPDGSSAQVLKYLGCVVQWSHGRPAGTLHASFADYLMDHERSGGRPWAIDRRADSHFLSLRCLRILNRELRFNICGLENSHILNNDVHDMPNRVAANISPPLSYSSDFWSSHIQETSFDEEIVSAIEKFFYRKFVYWLEVLSVGGKMNTASIALEIAAYYIKGHDADLTSFIDDTIKFVSTFAPVISQSATQLYLSALPFAPKESMMAQRFTQSLPSTLRFASVSGAQWPNIQKILHGHAYAVTSVDFSPDSTQIVTSSVDRSLRLWDVRSGTLIGALEGHRAKVTSVNFSQDGTRICSGSNDKTIRVWDASTCALVAGPFHGHTGNVTSVSFSTDGTRIASGSADKTVLVWDVGTEKPVAGPCEGHTKLVASVNFSADGTRVVSGSWDTTIRIWSAQTGTLISGPFEGHTHCVTSVHFSPDGIRVASGSWDNTVRVSDARTGALITAPCEGHTDWVTSVKFSTDGTRIVSGSKDNTVRVWDAQAGNLVAGPFQGHTDDITSVSFSTDGTQIASGSQDKTVRVWDTRSGIFVAQPSEGHTGQVTSVNFSTDGTRLVSGSEDKAVCVWDARSGTLVVGPFYGHTEKVTSVTFSKDGARIASGSQDKTIRVWDALSGGLVAGPLHGHTWAIASVIFSPDGTEIISGSEDKTVRIWDGRKGTLVAGPFHIGPSIHLSPDGTRALSISSSSSFKIWDARTGTLCAGPFKANPFVISLACISFSDDGNRIATSGLLDRDVRIWDAINGTLVARPLQQSVSAVTSVSLSPDGTRVASASPDGTLSLQDVQSGAIVATFRAGHGTYFTFVHFSSDGLRIATISRDSTVSIFEVSHSNIYNPLGAFPKFHLSGWVSNTNGELMFWVPPWLREGLYHPAHTLMIRSKGTTKLDLSHFVHGTEWQKCIDPTFRDVN
ncbi:WD40 repeat-like protein, partial [Mycena capillaripes]